MIVCAVFSRQLSQMPNTVAWEWDGSNPLTARSSEYTGAKRRSSKWPTVPHRSQT